MGSPGSRLKVEPNKAEQVERYCELNQIDFYIANADEALSDDTKSITYGFNNPTDRNKVSKVAKNIR